MNGTQLRSLSDQCAPGPRQRGAGRIFDGSGRASERASDRTEPKWKTLAATDLDKDRRGGKGGEGDRGADDGDNDDGGDRKFC